MKALISAALGASAEELAAFAALVPDITVHADEHVLPEHPEDYDIVLTNSLFHYTDIRRYTALRYVQLFSVGYDRIDLNYCREQGILVHNVGDIYSIPMAEWALMEALSLLKHQSFKLARQAECVWKKDRGQLQLAGRRALVVGGGAYGQAIAKRLKAFDVHVTLLNRSERPQPYADEFSTLEALDRELPKADLVFLAVALTPETRGLMSAERFALMQPGAVFINGARGALINTDALRAALTEGRLAGAALDVFESEPLRPQDPLWQCPNLLLTPHDSFIGERNHSDLVRVCLQNLTDYLSR